MIIPCVIKMQGIISFPFFIPFKAQTFDFFYFYLLYKRKIICRLSYTKENYKKIISHYRQQHLFSHFIPKFTTCGKILSPLIAITKTKIHYLLRLLHSQKIETFVMYSWTTINITLL